MAGERTEKATPKKRQDERKKGNVFQSSDVVSVISVVVMFYAVKYISPIVYPFLRKCFVDFMALAAQTESIAVGDMRIIYMNAIIPFGVIAMPLLLLAAFLGIVLSGIQTKFIFNNKPLKFKASRLNPLAGLKKMFSLRGLVELLKAILKITVLGTMVYSAIKKKIPFYPRAMDLSPAEAFIMTGDSVMSVVSTVAAVLIAIAAADYGYQWWEYEKNLRMSKQDIKDEYKQIEGNPEIKGKIKQKQQEMSQARMMQDVPNADVVVRNPTHYAVAIKYDSENNAAPLVIAKGTDLLALKIVEVAEENKVYITENVPLARGLYEEVDLGREIPQEFYGEVATVLAFVYNLKNKKTHVKHTNGVK